MERVDYTNTFIAVAPDSSAESGTSPPADTSVAARTLDLIAGHPYEFTSGDVIFTVWADRRGIPEPDRAQARAEFYATSKACLRSSDLGKRYGWGIHADADARIAVYPVDSTEYAALAGGRSPDGEPVSVRPAMRSVRAP